MKSALRVFFLFAILSQAAESQSWVSLSGPQIVSEAKDISVTADSNLYVADADYVVRRTSDAWSITSSPYADPVVTLVKPNNTSVAVAAISGSLSVTDNGGASWTEEINHGVPLRLSVAITDNNYMWEGRVYESGKKSIWRSTNGGTDWIESRFSAVTNVTDFAPHPTTSGLVWACGTNPGGAPEGTSNEQEASSSGLWFSYDNGDNWVASVLPTYNLRSIVIFPIASEYGMLAAANVSGDDDVVLRNVTISDPEAWYEVFSDAADVYMVRRKKNSGSLFLATNRAVWRSVNNGANWTQKKTGMGSDTTVLSIASVGNSLFAGTTNTIYKSTDDGDNWVDIGKMNVSSVDGEGGTVFAVSRDNSFAGRTTNGGSSWTNTHLEGVGATISAEYIHRIPDNGYLLVGGGLNNKAAIYRCTNASSTFTFSQEYYNSGTFSSGSRIKSVASDLHDYDNWVYASGGISISGTWKNLFKSENHGDDWSALSYPDGTVNENVVDFVAYDNAARYAISSDGEVFKTVNTGQDWPSVLSASGTGKDLELNPNDTSCFFASRSGGLSRTVNGGVSWTTMRTGNVARTIISPSYYSNDKVFVLAKGTSVDTIYTSTNGGTTGTMISSGLPQPINDIRTSKNAGFLYAGTSRGAYKYDIAPRPPTNFAAGTSVILYENTYPKLTWSSNTEVDVTHYVPERRKKMNGTWGSWSSLTAQSGNEFVDYGTIIGASGANDSVQYKLRAKDAGDNLSDFTNNVISYELSDVFAKAPVGIVADELPTHFSLSENFPNPFNPVTTIRYTLPVDADVNLTVVDVLGREVSVLVNERQTPGYKSVEFNASNFASGVYLYKLTAGTFSDIKKMIVTK